MGVDSAVWVDKVERGKLFHCGVTCRNHFLLTYDLFVSADKFENQNINYIGGHCQILLNGMDYRIREPKPFNTGWYLHKFNGPGARSAL